MKWEERMRSQMIKKLTLLALGIAVVLLAQPAGAYVVHYGTGLHHWVKSCTYPDGHGTSEYVGASSCPPYVVLPSNCTCTYTSYDFPVGNPYPYFRVVAGPDDNNPGNVNVIVDAAQVIECGVTVESTCDNGEGACGAAFTTVPADASQINPGVLELLEALRPEMEQKMGTPVRSFTYRLAQPEK